MPVRFRNYARILVSLSLILAFCLIEGEAQTRRKKRTRRATKPAVARPVITNPTITPPATTAQATASPEKTPAASNTGDVKIISTADETVTDPTEQPAPKKARTTTSTPAEPEDMQQTITDLSKQVNRLADKLSEMQEDDRYALELERLTRAEQRAEQLRMQLVDVQSKIADLETKLEEIEYALKPENLERATQVYGSTRPEEVRETRRRQLESERTRLKAQLRILSTSQSRLEVSCANADNEVDLLRARLQMRREQMEAAPKTKKPEQE